MKSLSDLAAHYEKWAEANETTAKDLLSSLDSKFVGEMREYQRWRASWLMGSAAELRVRAAELRKMERSLSTSDSSPLPLQVLTPQ